MRVAFVGVKRKYRELPFGYADFFDQFHLELPYYYARGCNDVTVTTVDDDNPGRPVGSGHLDRMTEDKFRNSSQKFDVVVHWRKWFPELHRPEAVNVINCQDHSFSAEWITTVQRAYSENKLTGILCFPFWHKQNLAHELGGKLPTSAFFDGVTLGVDTDIYRPHPDKDPYSMLWASDPGRGLPQALATAMHLWHRDKRFQLHVCYPDYVTSMIPVRHPAIVWHGNVSNGPKLWDLFNKCGVLPYTSTFKEPSSRAHRQAQAAGSLVLYPPAMGTPSELIESTGTGIVEPVDKWVGTIHHLVTTGEWKKYAEKARALAVAENWQAQATRFNTLITKIRGEI